MRILVTGGAGSVCSVSVERLATGHRAAAGEARIVVAGYFDRPVVEALLDRERIEAILHCAARSLVAESIADPAKYYRENVAGGVALLEAARSGGVRRMVFSSSAAVYGIPDTTPIAGGRWRSTSAARPGDRKSVV